MCECSVGWIGDTCEQAQCPNDCSNHGTCVDTTDPPLCNCDYSWSADDCSQGDANLDSTKQSNQFQVEVYSSIAVVVVVVAIVTGAIILYRRKRRREFLTALRRACAQSFDSITPTLNSDAALLEQPTQL